jgi:hypothetical protein
MAPSLCGMVASGSVGNLATVRTVRRESPPEIGVWDIRRASSWKEKQCALPECTRRFYYSANTGWRHRKSDTKSGTQRRADGARLEESPSRACRGQGGASG